MCTLEKETHVILWQILSLLNSIFEFADAIKPSIASVQKKLKYVKKDELDQIKNVAREMQDEIEKLSPTIYDMTEDPYTDCIRFPVEKGFVNIKLGAKTEFPFIILCNENSNEKLITCTYLFVGEAIKLLMYLNTRFNFALSDNLKFAEKSYELLNTDKFF